MGTPRHFQGRSFTIWSWSMWLTNPMVQACWRQLWSEYLKEPHLKSFFCWHISRNSHGATHNTRCYQSTYMSAYCVYIGPQTSDSDGPPIHPRHDRVQKHQARRWHRRLSWTRRQRGAALHLFCVQVIQSPTTYQTDRRSDKKGIGFDNHSRPKSGIQPGKKMCPWVWMRSHLLQTQHDRLQQFDDPTPIQPMHQLYIYIYIIYDTIKRFLLKSVKSLIFDRSILICVHFNANISYRICAAACWGFLCQRGEDCKGRGGWCGGCSSIFIDRSHWSG